jgi:hypothetical protein
MISGLLGLFSWGVVGVIAVGLWLSRHNHGDPTLDSVFWPLLIAGGVLFGALATVQILGAVLMRRLHSFGWAATAAILALIPWSVGWLIGLPFGILAINVLGRPNVVEGFYRDKRSPASGPPEAWRPRAHVASRFLSLFRSVGRYILPTMPGQKRAAEDYRDTPPSEIQSRVPGANYPGEAR